MKGTKVLLRATAGLAAVALAWTPGFAQTSAAQGKYVTLRFTPATGTAGNAHRVPREIRAVFSEQSSQAQVPLPTVDSNTANLPHSEGGSVGYSALRYPADVSTTGGPTVVSAQMHVIFMQQEGNVCAISACWGNPEGLLKDLGRSDFIHVADQYVGNTNDNRYTVGQGYVSLFQLQSQPFTDADMQAVVTAAAQASGQVGYGHIYHVFLPSGVDVCFDSTFAVCYSPDNPSSFFFCAYHSFFDVPGLGHLLYTVVPYQNTHACSVRPSTPNGSLIDSTNDVLTHETFETISDPDTNAWGNIDSFDASGGEIGDICVFFAFGAGGTYLGSDPSIWSVDGRIYATQPIYNNNRHACTTVP